MTRQPEIQLAYPYFSRSILPRIYFNDRNEDKIKYHQGLQRASIYNVSTPFKLICGCSAFVTFYFLPAEGGMKD